MTADVSKHGQGSGGDYRAADGEAIEPVGKIHGIAGSNQHQHHESHEGQKSQRPKVRMGEKGGKDQIWLEVFEEWKNQVSRELARAAHIDEHHRDSDARKDLQGHLATRSEAEIAMVYHFQVIVGEPDGAVGDSGEDQDPDEFVREVRPKDRGYNDGNGDQNAAHRRRPSFLLVRLWSFLADVLPDLEFA